MARLKKYYQTQLRDELKKGIRIGYKLNKNKKTRVNKSSGKEI